MKQKFLILAIAIVSLVVALLIGSILYWMGEYAIAIGFCPSNLREGMDCYAENWRPALPGLHLLVGPVIAFMAVYLSTLVGPRVASEVRRMTLLLGLVLAIPFALLMESLLAYLITAGMGTVTWLLIEKRQTKRDQNAMRIR